MKCSMIYMLFLLGLSIIFIPCSLYVYPFFYNTDGCEHLAAVKELAHSLINPVNPHLNLPGRTSPRFVPSILLMAITQKIFTPDLFILAGIFSIISFLLLGLGIYLFSKEYFGDEKQAFSTLLSILFLWGKGWQESNSYMFSSLISFAYYPSIISFNLIPINLFYLLNYLKKRKPLPFIIFFFLSIFIFLNHPLTGLLYFFITFILLVTEGYKQKKNLFILSLTIFIAFGTTALWPYYPFLKTFLYVTSEKGKTFWDYQMTHKYLYSNHLERIGPAFLGLAAIIYLGTKRKYPFIINGFFACLLLYSLGYFFDISLCERLVFFCLFFSQLAFSRLFRLLLKGKSLFKNIIMVNLIIIIFSIAIISGISNQLFMTGKIYLPYILKKYPHPMEKYFSLRSYLKRGDIIISDVFTSWPIPCITEAKVISLYHNSPLIPENMERLVDTVSFFQFPSERWRILKKYEITHVLLNKKLFPPCKVEKQAPQFFIPYPDNKLIQSLLVLGNPILNDENFFIVKIDNNKL